MARQVALQWPGVIPRPRSIDCSATPSDSMKWRHHVDHGQKHETGDWMHLELDDQGPITEAEPRESILPCALCGIHWIASVNVVEKVWCPEAAI